MVVIELNPAQQQRLEELAKSQGQDGKTFAQRILSDYLEFAAIPLESDEAWAEASVTLAPEVMGKEDWGESGNGS